MIWADNYYRKRIVCTIQGGFKYKILEMQYRPGKNVPTALARELNASPVRITNTGCARANIDSPILNIFPNLFNELSKYVFV